MKTLKWVATLKKNGSKPNHQQHLEGRDLQQHESEAPEVKRQLAEGSVQPIQTPDILTALRITMTVRFESPLDYSFTKAYDASPTFEDTDPICDGLKEHIEHWTNELITRHDVEAAEPLGGSPLQAKDARYHMIYRIDRRGQPWAERHYASFQKQPMSIETSRNVIIEADRMVAKYVQHHDAEFEWRLPDFMDEDPMRHTLSKPNVNHPHPLCCVPTYMDEAGYSVDISLRTRDSGHSRNWENSFESRQVTPLTLDVAEGLMSNVSEIIRHAVDEQERTFLSRHTKCNGQEGTQGCRHYKADAFDLVFQVRNILGPDYKHLSTQLKSYRVLFPRHEDDRFNSFVERLQTRITRAVGEADQFMEEANDLKIQIHELRGEDWQVKDPMVLILDGSGCASRDPITKVTQRLPVGIKHELDGHGVSAVITVHKRGHLLFDSIVCGDRATDQDDHLQLARSSDFFRTRLQAKVLERVQRDLATVWRDTVKFSGKNPLAALQVFTRPDTAKSPALQSQAISYTPDGSPAEAIGHLLRKHRSDNLQSPIKRNRAQKESDDENGCSSDDGSQKKPSNDAIPSLADTASINLPEGAVTPDTTPEWDVKWMPGALGVTDHGVHDPAKGDHSHHETTVIHHEAHMGEAIQVLISNIAVPETGEVSEDQAPRSIHGTIKHMPWSEESTEDSLTLALLGPKDPRGQETPIPEILIGGLQAPPKAHQQPGHVSSITTIYNMPNEHIGDSDLSAPTPKDVDKGESITVEAKSDRSKGRFASKIPRFFPRTVSPQLVSASSTYVNVTGHIPRRQLTSTSEIGLGLSRQISAGITLVDSTIPQSLGMVQNEQAPQKDTFASGAESSGSLDSFDHASDIF